MEKTTLKGIKDIKSGYLVKLSNGKFYIKRDILDIGSFLLSYDNEIINFNIYNDNIEINDIKGEIAAVFGYPKNKFFNLFSTQNRDLLYEYNEKKHDKEENKEDYVIKILYEENKCRLIGKNNNLSDLIDALSVLTVCILKETNGNYVYLDKGIMHGYSSYLNQIHNK